jgi:hypothetical protein
MERNTFFNVARAQVGHRGLGVAAQPQIDGRGRAYRIRTGLGRHHAPRSAMSDEWTPSQRYREMADRSAELAKIALSNEARAQLYADAERYLKRANASAPAGLTSPSTEP